MYFRAVVQLESTIGIITIKNKSNTNIITQNIFFNKNFEGTIPMGTPIAQMIPIKRESWNLVIDDSIETYEKHDLMSENRRSHVTGHYRKFAWRKKEYRKSN